MESIGTIGGRREVALRSSSSLNHNVGGWVVMGQAGAGLDPGSLLGTYACERSEIRADRGPGLTEAADDVC